MMNYIWIFMVLFSIVCSFFNGNAANLTDAVLSGGSQAVELALKLLGMLCLWCGLMNIAEKSGLCEKIAKLLKPLINFLMPGIKNNADAKNAVSMNLTANLLGLGNAATPFGITAMKKLQEQNKNKTSVSAEMAVFVVMNTAALKIIPSTMASLRAAAGAKEPMDIIFCVWISSALSLMAAITAVKVFGRWEK